VAWSPKGDYIAFVSAYDRSDELAVDARVVDKASVWLMKNPGTSGKIQLRKLAQRTVGQGIPVALFWPSSDEVAWAASAEYPKGFTMCAARVSDGKVRQLTNRRFNLHHVEVAGEEPYDGPKDIYYDRPTRSVFFTGDNAKTESDKGPVVFVGRYSFTTDKLDILRTQLAWLADICTYTGSDNKTDVYLYGSYGNPGERMVIRRIQWPDVNHMQKAANGSWSIRISPDGKTLSWIEEDENNLISSLILYDLNSKTRTVAAKWKSKYAMGPFGCVYSWSPTGRVIAYTDGKQIYIVPVKKSE
jgi:hypothetical protein